jgi:hypothetical protein
MSSSERNIRYMKRLVCALQHLVPWGTDPPPVLVLTRTC